MKKFNENLKELLTEKGISQEALAEFLNVSKQNVSLYCVGKTTPTYKNLLRIAEFFNTSTDYLLTGEKVEHQVLRSELGLTESAVEHIISLANKKILNALLEQESFYSLLMNINANLEKIAEVVAELKNNVKNEILLEILNTSNQKILELTQDFFIKNKNQIFMPLMREKIRSKQSGTPEKVE